MVSATLALNAPQASADAMMTQTFNYTGSTQSFTVPAGVTALGVTIVGGQGGRGGTDSAGPSPAGGYAGQVQGTIAVTPGQVLTIAVGSGGGSGTGGGAATGGSAGSNPLAGYEGGTGGRSGTNGSSGSGGGGGAASVLQVGGVDIVAGGAGGSGGSGQYAPIVGRLAEDHFVARSDATDTSGRPGVSPDAVAGHNVDGGGSGAGGGGAQGGERGADQYGGATATEWFGFGGYPGSNSSGGLSGLSESYQYYSGNNASGSITLTYSVGVPDPVRSVVGAAGNALIDVYWMPPLSEGGAPITDYIVRYSTNPSGPFTTFADGVSTGTRATITGLTNGTPYYLQVSAVNALGESLPTTQATFPVTPTATPDPKPILLHAYGGDALATLEWSDLSPPGATVTDYQVEYATSVGGPWTTFPHAPFAAQTIQVTGLTNGTPYLFRVAAITTAGQEPFSNAASATPLGSPTAPVITSVTPMSSTLRVAFTPPTNTGGSPITGYQYQLDGGTWMSASQTASPLIIGGLNNGQAYSIAIRALTAAAAGVASSPESGTPYGLPGMVPGFTATPSTSSVTLNWDAAAPNGSPVQFYNVILWSAPTSGSIVNSTMVPGTDRTTTFSGLAAGPRYFTIEALNAAGTGPRTPDRVTAIVGGTPPAAPQIDEVQAAGTTVAIDWTSGAAGSSPVVGYRVRYVSDDGDIAMLASSPSPGNEATVTLPSLEPYRLEIYEYSNAGVGGSTTIRPPMVSTGTAIVNPEVTSVDLAGVANANGSATDLRFEISTVEADLGSPASRVAATPSTDSSTSEINLRVADHGIDPGTTYYYRAVAESGDMITRGETRSFTTDVIVDIADPAKGYDGEPIDISKTTEPAGLSTSEQWVGINGTSYGPTGVAPAEAGDYRVTVTVTTPGYSGSRVSEVSISRASQTVTLEGIDPDATVGESFDLVASASTGLTTVLSIIEGGGTVCELRGTSLKMNGEGDCVVEARQPGTRNHAPAFSVFRVEVLAADEEAPTPPPESTDDPGADEEVGAGTGVPVGDSPKPANQSGEKPATLAFTGISLLRAFLPGLALTLGGLYLILVESQRGRRKVKRTH